METPADRLRQARIAKGYDQASDAAAAFGWNRNTYLSNENGNAPFSYKKAAVYAQAFGVAADWLYSGSEGGGRGAGAPASIPVVGYVGAASEYFGFDDHAQGSGLDEIEAPPGVPESAVAVIVRGDSGYPAIREGMVLIYWNCLADPVDVVGEDCFVKLKDGRTLVKILERGSAPGLYTLNSINSSTAPIRDVEVEWAAPIEIRLRRKNWKG
jgi:phage repressor protein C with HTH and peptisase S24 domain